MPVAPRPTGCRLPGSGHQRPAGGAERAQGPAGGAVLLPEGQHARLHHPGPGLSRSAWRVSGRQHPGVRRLARQPEIPRELPSAKQAFPFELISDPDEQLCQLFERDQAEEAVRQGIPGHRAQHLPDRPGRRAAPGMARVKVPGHVDAVLAAAQALQRQLSAPSGERIEPRPYALRSQYRTRRPALLHAATRARPGARRRESRAANRHRWRSP